MADPRSKALDQGRALEKAGRIAEAVTAYREAGATEEAARLLAANKQVAEAAQLLLASVGNVRPSQVGQLDAPGKKRVLMAAILLSRGSDVPFAVELFLGLGERARAVEALQKSGDGIGAAKLQAGQGLPAPVLLSRQGYAVGGAAETPEAARKLEAQGKLDVALEMWVRLKKFSEGARVARALGRLADAAQLHADAGQPIEAAWCYRQVGDTGKALENLVRVPRNEPRYRAAALEAVSLSSELKVVTVAFEQFVGDFVRNGPLADSELAAFDKLARLYVAHDHLSNAREVLQRLAARAPNYQDAFARLKALERDARATPLVAARVLADEDSRRRRLPSMELPSLDDLPPLHDAILLLGDVPPPFEELEPMHDDQEPASQPPLEELPLDAITGSHARDETLPELEPEPSRPPVVQRPIERELDENDLTSPSAPVQDPDRTLLTGLSLPPLPAPKEAPPPARAAPKPTNPIPAKATATFIPGASVASRYRLEEQIGTGGMAAVFRATDLELDEEVALKVFTLAEASEVAVQRFKQELKLSRQLTHPNIIRLHDIGLHEGHRYISMELLKGESLKTRLLNPVGFVEALKILEQACAGLQAAHDHGVVHRDVKPDNFFLTREGVLKVMDFGIAKQQAAPGVTVVGSIAGTPAYMSPEQISNFSAVGPATDLYALGIIAYEIFTGAVPFAHDDLVPLLLLHVNQPPVAPRERNPGIPEELERVILKLLEKNPLRRHGSAKELMEELKVIRESYGG